eukprot:TRINITY_DN2772_c0_g1_i1.p1 TRINITY_DN2772_c0_g1~~TRINITY_DN2772_c0_g1_i1.p1  ORF type:complete len:409 (-),score=90.89 TRINITY_DN2772_c0_g1_i1:173-1399(-)
MSVQDRKHFVVASRISALAMWQTEHVIATLQKANSAWTFEVLRMETKGDKQLDKPLAALGEKGLFTAELEAALLEGRADFAVHSLKDLPTRLPAGLTLGAISARADPTDALVLRETGTEHVDSANPDPANPDPSAPDAGDQILARFPRGAVIGTSSLRRAAQLRERHPHLVIRTVRGNVATRLKRLDSGEYDAILLAAAGLQRLGLDKRIAARLHSPIHLHAPGQGALAIECRMTDEFLRMHVLPALHCVESAAACLAERAFLHALDGGCQVPLGAVASVRPATSEELERIASEVSAQDSGSNQVTAETTIKMSILTLHGAVWSLDGSNCLRAVLELPVVIGSEKVLDVSSVAAHAEGKVDSSVLMPKDVGVRLAAELMKKGAAQVLLDARAQCAKDNASSSLATPAQ